MSSMTERPGNIMGAGEDKLWESGNQKNELQVWVCKKWQGSYARDPSAMTAEIRPE